ncbi:centrosomal protein 290kDa [Glossina fuscipes fuscipes]
MDLPEVVSVKKFNDFTNEQKDHLYETLLELAVALDELPKKSLRKTLELTLAVLQYKGKQVQLLQEQLDEKSQSSCVESLSERLMIENEKLTQLLTRTEDEKLLLRDKNKGLIAENFQLKQRLKEITANAEASDKDSSDPLSELDKQESLLRNINLKNKHIKRLLKEIEALQNENIEQSKTIIDLEKRLKCEKENWEELNENFLLLEKEKTSLREAFDELTIEIKRLENNINYLEDEKERSEKELQEFVDKLEKKAQSWKKLLLEKDKELKKLKTKTNKLDGSERSQALSGDESTDTDVGANGSEKFKLYQAIEARDKLIEQLELKIQIMADEMLAATQLMNRIYQERNEEMNPRKPRSCCANIEALLKASTAKCRELSDMLERAEEECAIKAKQAMEATKSLAAFQCGEDGLLPALRRCSALESKLQSRENQIRSLITELNSMHEIGQENSFLRKRLNIPDDAIISTKNLAAKERNKGKIIDRLNLKLRASEEMRLQLKLEKSDLRKEILELKQLLLTASNNTAADRDKSSEILAEEDHGIIESTEMNSKDDTPPYQTLEINKLTRKSPTKEIGEVDDSNNTPEASLAVTVCTHCHGNYKIELQDPGNTGGMDMKYQDIAQENEILRQGMLEILEKLKEYGDMSEQIVIDKTLLSNLLKILKSPDACQDSPLRLQEEMLELKQKEQALEELLKQHIAMKNYCAEDDAQSVESMREDGEIRNAEELPIEMPTLFDSSTRPTTPNRSHSLLQIPNISHESTWTITEKRQLEQEVDELKIYRKHYEELYLHMKASDLEVMQACAELTEKTAKLETDLMKAEKCLQYLKEDLDNSLSKMKEKQMFWLEKESKYKMDIKNLEHESEHLKREKENCFSIYCYSREEYLSLQKSFTENLMKLSLVTQEILSGKSMDSINIPDLNMDYGIIIDNYQLDVIPLEEFKKENKLNKEFQEQKTEMLKNIAHLESLLLIAREQIQSQQKLLNDITDNHIGLRHLVADLQSTSEEKFLIAKIQRDLDNAKLEIDRLRDECAASRQHFEALQQELLNKEKLCQQLRKNFHNERANREIKLKFLQKSLLLLKEKYAKYTPLIFLTNFICAYKKFQNSVEENSEKNYLKIVNKQIEELIKTKLSEQNIEMEEQPQLIKLIKSETQCRLYEDEVKMLQNKCRYLEKDLNELRLNQACESEHWKTVQALFGSEKAIDDLVLKTEKNLKAVEKILTQDIACNTEAPIPAERKRSLKPAQVDVLIQTEQESPKRRDSKKGYLAAETEGGNQIATRNVVTETKEVQIQTCKQRNLQESKAIQTLEETNATNVMNGKPHKIDSPKTNELQRTLETLKATENRLTQANLQIEELKSKLNSLQALKESESSTELSPASTKTDVIEKTILSFHTLLSEKDKSIGKYQDILQTEREQNHLTVSKLNAEIEGLNHAVTQLNVGMKNKDLEILELKTQLESISVRRNSSEKLQLATIAMETEENVDNSLNEMTDEKIEEMFQQENSPPNSATGSIVIAPEEVVKEKHELEGAKTLLIPTNIMKQLKELKDKASYYESALKVKEDEIVILKEKVKLLQDREKSSEITNNTEVEQLRIMVEEKDKHINELLETLNNFHEDQERFITDSSSYTTDQITQLANDLTRTEATNKIYYAQVEALKKQLTNLTQREKQARDLSQSLRNQLIKRPVVSIKTELNARVKNESLQKRAQQLELDLEEARAEIQRQKVIIDNKRHRSAHEVGLWEKQKRWQQNAEKLKGKLEDTEATLEKTKTLLQSARNTVNRLEKDKQMLEAKLGRATHQTTKHSIKCCRAPSCPNLHNPISTNAAIVKYTTSESPDTVTAGSSECSSPVRNVTNNKMQYTVQAQNQEVIDALKTRLEMQQRKILVMELAGKGSHALTNEMEKLQEKLSTIESQNIRLEAKNLQLQLDNDLLRQGDGTERFQKRIKHLEDYIMALKEEIASSEARRQLCKCSGVKVNLQTGQSAEHTILSLRNLVEKLKAENKYLKDGRRSSESRSSSEAANDTARLQQKLHDSLDKISSLELKLKAPSKCPHCESRQKVAPPPLQEELNYIKEQLHKKTQLLQKAKVLLTRAAAKEKVLKEQLTMWKRKCFELQNVPVIEEISE